jgi:hypothetical protein
MSQYPGKTTAASTMVARNARSKFVFCDPIRRPTLAMNSGEIAHEIAVDTASATPVPVPLTTTLMPGLSDKGGNTIHD